MSQAGTFGRAAATKAEVQGGGAAAQSSGCAAATVAGGRCNGRGSIHHDGLLRPTCGPALQLTLRSTV